MKLKSLPIFLCAMLAATPALALKVTNLDKVPHRVLFKNAGSEQVREIPAGETAYFSGEAEGTLSLLDVAPKEGKGTLQADGYWLRTVNGGRNQNMVATQRDFFAIWPNGDLLLQGRRTGYNLP